MHEERLQKVMAAAGVGSRRACEQLIVAGKVRVNGRVVDELGAKVDPEQVHITVDGKPIKRPARRVYFKVYKPRAMLGDIGEDPDGRRGVLDLIPAEMRRVFPVGRLDFQSEGLMLLTDDGELAHHLTHPRFQHPKIYYVLVEQQPTAAALAQFHEGIDLPEGRTAPASIRVVHRLPAELSLGPGATAGVWLKVVLREGKKRQIRQMTAAIGHPTLRLVRWAIGPLTLEDLKVGEAKPLSRREVAALRAMVVGAARPAANISNARHASPARRPPRRRRRNRRPGATK